MLSRVRFLGFSFFLLTFIPFAAAQEAKTPAASEQESAKPASNKEPDAETKDATKDQAGTQPSGAKPESIDTKEKEAAKQAPVNKPKADANKKANPEGKGKKENKDVGGGPAKKLLPKLGSTKNTLIPGTPWRIHDLKRPRPRHIEPGVVDTAPPADAIVLFDGRDLTEWYHAGQEDELFEPLWTVHDGYFEITPKTGSIYTVESFGSCQLHIEWMIPEGTDGTSQGRGNSGVKLMERYEVQILDSYDNRTYADGQAASIYGQYPPLVNATRAQGQWQAYDIFFEAPVFENEKLVAPPHITVIHNGILVHHHRPLLGPTGLRTQTNEIIPPAAPIMLQDHGNKIRFRNIWLRQL